MNMSLIAQTASSQCTLNGQPVSCAELVHKVKPYAGLIIGLIAVFLIIMTVIFIFWLLMLIHAIQHKSPERDTWILILVVSFVTGFSLVGALVYYFVEKKKAEQAVLPSVTPVPPAAPPPAPPGNQAV